MLDSYARSHHFDPLLPNRWYTVSLNSLFQEKVEERRERRRGEGEGGEEKGRERGRGGEGRGVPRSHHFDPLLPNRWYTVSLNSLFQEKVEEERRGGERGGRGGEGIREGERRREGSARSHHFDPLTPNRWYSVSLNSLFQEKVEERRRGEGGEGGRRREGRGERRRREGSGIRHHFDPLTPDPRCR